ASSYATRLAETSTTEPQSGANARRTMPSTSAAWPGVSMTSHSSGPSHSALRSPRVCTVLGTVGSATPSASPTRSATALAARTLTWVRYCPLPIAPLVRRVVEHRRCHGRRDGSVLQWRVQRTAEPLAAAAYQRERKRPPER